MDKQKKITAAEINMDMVTAGLDPCKAAAEDAKAAIQAYWDDIECRKAELEKQARGYQKQIDDLTAQRKKLATQSMTFLPVVRLMRQLQQIRNWKQSTDLLHLCSVRCGSLTRQKCAGMQTYIIQQKRHTRL